jgi:hypothetical protein
MTSLAEAPESEEQPSITIQLMDIEEESVDFENELLN